MQSRKLEKLQKNSKKIQTNLLWWQNKWNCEQEVWPMGTNKLDQEMQTPSCWSYSIWKMSIYWTKRFMECSS